MHSQHGWGARQAEVADLRRQCSELEDQLLVKVTELTEAVKVNIPALLSNHCKRHSAKQLLPYLKIFLAVSEAEQCQTQEPALSIMLYSPSELRLEFNLSLNVNLSHAGVQMKEHLAGLLEGDSSAVARLERDNENLEGQVDQLTISLVDATSKKSDADKRLRQYQQVCPRTPLHPCSCASSPCPPVSDSAANTSSCGSCWFKI